MANNFSGDNNCKALWRFESGALITDSKGTNTLTISASPTANTTTYKEGSASVQLNKAESDYLFITDTNLNAGFPLKDGDTNKKISICCWAYVVSSPSASAGYVLWSKWYPVGTQKRSFVVMFYNDAGIIKARIGIGYGDGSLNENYNHASGLSLSTWYHITSTYDNADKSYAIRIRDANGNIVGTDLTGTATLDANGVYVSTQEVRVGTLANSAWFWDGEIDEMVAFSDIITAAEATQIAQGTYGTSGLSIPVAQHHYNQMRNN